MIDFGVGTVIEDMFEVRKLDSDYFDEAWLVVYEG